APRRSPIARQHTMVSGSVRVFLLRGRRLPILRISVVGLRNCSRLRFLKVVEWAEPGEEAAPLCAKQLPRTSEAHAVGCNHEVCDGIGIVQTVARAKLCPAIKDLKAINDHAEGEEASMARVDPAG